MAITNDLIPGGLVRRSMTDLGLTVTPVRLQVAITSMWAPNQAKRCGMWHVAFLNAVTAEGSVSPRHTS